MKPLYTQEEFNLAKANNKLACECYLCQKTFYTEKKKITSFLKHQTKPPKYCSHDCQIKSKDTKIELSCTNCNTIFRRQQKELKKANNYFCSKSCSASYNNKNKTTGNRRSKLEIYLEEQLTILYPNLHIDYNKKEAISSELDIYIPSLNLAFELNGIFHYEPIYGSNKLDQIQNNDQNKFKLCIENKIDLCIIDTSSQQKFKINTSKRFLDIITNIINQRTTLTI
jgi:hypothetical protein